MAVHINELAKVHLTFIDAMMLVLWWPRAQNYSFLVWQSCSSSSDSFMNAPNGNKKERERILQLVARHVTFATYYLRESFQTVHTHQSC